MSKVVGLPGIVARTFEPDAECIKLLERMLEDARSGAIVAVAIATVGPQEVMGTGWKGGGSRRTMAAAVGLLHHRFYTAWNGDRSDEVIDGGSA